MDGWMNEWIDGHWTDVWTHRFPLYSTGHHPRFGAAAQKEIGKEREREEEKRNKKLRRKQDLMSWEKQAMELKEDLMGSDDAKLMAQKERTAETTKA